MSYLLDASALLAYLQQESGWEKIHGTIEGCRVSSVNWSEVAQKTEQKGLDFEKAKALLLDLGLTIESLSAAQAEAAASLWKSTHKQGLSLADRACLAVAQEQNLPVLTADRTWSKLKLPIEVQLIR